MLTAILIIDLIFAFVAMSTSSALGASGVLGGPPGLYAIAAAALILANAAAILIVVL